MVSFGLKGIYSALITPMYPNEEVNYDAIRQLVRLQLKDGTEGFYCCGSSGEGLLLSLEEREKVLETVLDEVRGQVPVISHIGTIRTADVIRLARHAKAAGAAAVSMIPPYYYHFTMAEIIGYYQEAIRAVPGLPFIIYNIPQFTGVSFNKENAGALLESPAIIGVKHTSMDMYGLERMASSYPDKIYFNGFDEAFLSGLAAGAGAAIGTTVNLYPATFKAVRDAFGKGDMAQARKLQSLINHRVEVMVRAGIFNAVKYGFLGRGIDCGSCRSPFAKLTPAARQSLDELFAEGFGSQGAL